MFFTFSQTQHVLNMYLNFWQFSASCYYKKGSYKKRVCSIITQSVIFNNIQRKNIQGVTLLSGSLALAVRLMLARWQISCQSFHCLARWPIRVAFDKYLAGQFMSLLARFGMRWFLKYTSLKFIDVLWNK